MDQSTIRTLIAALACAFGMDASADLSIQISSLDATCGNPTGSASAFASGGTPPYTYLWSTSADTQSITGLAPGAYSVTVTDAVGDEVTGQVIIINLASPTLEYNGPGAGLHGCQGLCNHGIWYYEYLMPQNLVPPFTFSNPPITGLPLNPSDSAWVGFCDGVNQYITNVTDGNGCVASLYSGWFLDYGSNPGPMTVVSTTPSCDGLAGGSVTVNVGLELNNAYTSLWNTTLFDENMVAVPGHPIFARPMLGENVELERNLPPGDYYLERRFQNLQGDCVDLLPVTIPSLGNNCGAVNGTAFMDYNENCQNNGEAAVPGGIVEVMPGPVYTELIDGSYIVCLPPGNYTLQQFSPAIDEHCDGAPIPFTITASTVPVNVPLPDTSLVSLDLAISMASGPARPGFQFQCSIHIQNLTPNASGAITLTMDFDAVLGFVSALPAAGNVSGNTITWNLPQLTGWQSSSVLVYFNVPPDPLLLGTQLVSSSAVSSVSPDGDPLNSVAEVYTTVTGSYDPNDKTAHTSTGQSDSLYFIAEDEWIDYTIRFQNTGTDTAFNILITDTLSITLDPATLIMGASSHAFSWELRDAGTLKFYFPNILLPDSNVNEPPSHGFVGFRIRPRLPVLPGTNIENIANIYFDFNPPVITEPSMLVAEFSTGVSRGNTDLISAFPNPAEDRLWLMGASSATNGWSLTSADGRVLITSRNAFPKDGLSLMGLAEGSYCLRVNTATGTTSIRFIKLQ
jgi:uncharacterized repeat protein (TIGR01451 family)